MSVCPVTGHPCDLMKLHNVSVVNEGQCQHMSLCDRCAASYFNDEAQRPLRQPSQTRKMVGLKDVLELLQSGDPPKPKKEPPVRRCPNCKSTLERISKIGRLGCVKCFDYFGQELAPVLTKMGEKPAEPPEAHSEPPTTPAEPDQSAVQEKYEKLKLELSEALGREDYEQAGRIRDKIKAVQSIQREKSHLERKLDEAVQKEDFEKAGEIKQLVSALVEQIIKRLG
jgi:protein arginine kinase activator